MSRAIFVPFRILCLALLLLLVSCGSVPTDSGNSQLPGALSLTPDHGSPGTVIALSGYVPDTAGVAELTALVGGLPAPVQLSPTGQLLSAVPLLAAGSDGQSPPPAAVDVEILQGDVVVARATGGFTVAGLVPAPGSTRASMTALIGVGTEMMRVANLLNPQVGVEQQWTSSLSAAVSELVGGTDAGTLSAAVAALEQDSPATLTLVDAVLASSGVLGQTQALLASLQAVDQPALAAGGGQPKTFTSDLALAKKMQFYSLLKMFGETVIHETAEEFAYTVGLVTGVIGIGADVPVAGEIAAILAVADFAVNKVVVGLYPSTITDFNLTLEDRDLSLGDITTARVDIAARNTPPGVGIQDFVGLTLSLLGLKAGAQTENFRQILTGTASFYLGTLQQFISTYGDSHPEANLDVSINVVPHLTWEATITDPRLVDCRSHTPETVTGLTDQVNWQASPAKVGEGRIYVATSTDPGAVLLRLPPGFTYSGGAFGEQVAATPAITVNVTGTLVMQINFTDRLQPGESSQLTVTAGYVGSGSGGGKRTGAPGIHISVAVDGGTVADTQGDTDANGVFTTIAGMALDSNQLILSITATDDQFNRLTDSRTVVPRSSTVTASVGRVTDGDATAFCEAWPPDDNGDQYREVATDGISVDLHGSASDVTNDGGTATASISLNGTLTASNSSSSSTLGSNMSMTASASFSIPSLTGYFARASAGAVWKTIQGFEVQGDPVSYTLTASTNGVFSSRVYFALSSGSTWSGSDFVIGSGSTSGTLSAGSYNVFYEVQAGGVGGNSFTDQITTFSDNISRSASYTLELSY